MSWSKAAIFSKTFPFITGMDIETFYSDDTITISLSFP